MSLTCKEYVSVGKYADTDTKASPGNPLMLLVTASRLSSGEAGRNMTVDPPREQRQEASPQEGLCTRTLGSELLSVRRTLGESVQTKQGVAGRHTPLRLSHLTPPAIAS